MKELKWRAIGESQHVALTRGGEFVISRDIGDGTDFRTSYELVYFDEESEGSGIDCSFDRLEDAKAYAQKAHEEDWAPDPQFVMESIAPFVRLGYNEACTELGNWLPAGEEITFDMMIEKLDEMISGTREITSEKILNWLRFEANEEE